MSTKALVIAIVIWFGGWGLTVIVAGILTAIDQGMNPVFVLSLIIGWGCLCVARYVWEEEGL